MSELLFLSLAILLEALITLMSMIGGTILGLFISDEIGTDFLSNEVEEEVE